MYIRLDKAMHSSDASQALWAASTHPAFSAPQFCGPTCPSYHLHPPDAADALPRVTLGGGLLFRKTNPCTTTRLQRIPPCTHSNSLTH